MNKNLNDLKTLVINMILKLDIDDNYELLRQIYLLIVHTKKKY